MKTVLLLIATAMACDAGSGVERAVTSAVQDRTLLIPTDARGVRRHHDEVLAELSAELGLSADQSARVREIFARHHPERATAWAHAHANVQRAMQATTEIETVLDSAQIERLHRWLAERHRSPLHNAPGQEH